MEELRVKLEELEDTKRFTGSTSWPFTYDKDKWAECLVLNMKLNRKQQNHVNV